jgi:hypothetical protein
MQGIINKHPRIVVIFRACDLVNAVNKSNRPFGFDKKSIIKICFKSLYNALQGYNYKIIVLGDNLSPEMKAFFLNHDLQLNEGVFGNDNSIRESIKIALELDDNDWVYFCEDDYLHTPDSFEKIVTLIQERKNIILENIKFKQLLRKRHITFLSIPRYFRRPSLVIFPCDYPDRYLPTYLNRNFIFKTSNSHWRQVSDTTFTFLLQVGTLRQHKKTLIKAANRANDAYLSNTLYGKNFFYGKLLCLSPIPSLTSHMHKDTLSPLMDCESIINQVITKV